MDFYYVFGGYQKYNYSYVRDDDNANKNAIKGQLQNMWFQKGDEGKIYYSPFFSSSALASLTDYANTETVGKRLPEAIDGVITLPCSARISGEEL